MKNYVVHNLRFDEVKGRFVRRDAPARLREASEVAIPRSIPYEGNGRVFYAVFEPDKSGGTIVSIPDMLDDDAHRGVIKEYLSAIFGSDRMILFRRS